MGNYLILLVLLFGVVLGGLWMTLSAGYGLTGFFNFAIATIWAAYNATIILASIHLVLSKRHDRQEYRFPVNLIAILINKHTAKEVAVLRIKDLSLRGAKLILHETLDLENIQPLLYFLTPDRKKIIVPIVNINYSKKLGSGKQSLGVSFGTMSKTVSSNYLEFIFVTLPRLACVRPGGIT
jgi:hypothetical protein